MTADIRNGAAPTGPAPPSPGPAAPRRRLRRWLIGLAILLLAVPALAFAALWGLVASDAVRPRLIAAVEAATGRALTLSGPVRVAFSLVPTITLDGPALANPPGASRPEMIRARRIEAEVALLPLLSREVRVRRLHLVAPDLLLETDAQGAPNWRLGPAARPEAPPGADPAPAAPSRPFALAIEAVTVEDGRVTWRDPAREESVEVPQLTLRAPDPEAPSRLEGRLTARGVAVTVNATTGPLARLLRPDGAPWPVRAGLSAPGLNAELDGSLDLAARPAGWRGRLAATADGAARLAPFLPGVALPPARGLSLVAEAEAPARLRALHLSVGEWPLTLAGRAIVIGPVQLSAAAPDAPLAGPVSLRLGDLPLSGTVEGPSPDALRAAGPRPFAVSLAGEGATLSARGALGPAGWPGAAVTASLHAPDLAALGARIGLPNLPRLNDATLEATLAGLPDGADVTAATLTAREARAAGSGTWRTSPGASPRLTARLSADHLDADALLTPAAPAQADPPPQPAAPPPVQPAPPAAAARPAEGRVIPDRPLDLAALRSLPIAVEAEIVVRTLRWRGAEFRDAALSATVAEGRLRADPVAVTAPGGRLTGALTADATPPAPRLSLALRTADGAVELGPLLAAFGLPASITGPATLDVALHGEGATARALAAGLTGRAALTVTNGRIDPRLLAQVGGALRGVVPDGALGSAAALRCLALRAAVQDGVGQVETMVLRTPVAGVTGDGGFNLREETLALRLRPVVRIGDVTVTTPLRVGGTFAAPRAVIEPGGAAGAAAALLGGLARRSGDQGTAALGALAESLAGTPDGPADCGTAPAAPRPAAGDLLRGLLGR